MAGASSATRDRGVLGRFLAAQEDRSVRWLQAVIEGENITLDCVSKISATAAEDFDALKSTVRARAASRARARRAQRPRDDPSSSPSLRIGAATPLSGRRPAPLPLPPFPPSDNSSGRPSLASCSSRSRTSPRARPPASATGC